MTTIAKEKGQYVITRSRHINNEFIEASPEHPAVLEVPVGFEIDDGLIPIEKYRAMREGPKKPHYVVKRGAYEPSPEPVSTGPSVVVVDADLGKPNQGAPAPQGKGGKRPSDASPV